MVRARLHLLLAMLVLLPLGCDRSVSVGGDYTIAAKFSPDGQSRGNLLSYKGKKVWENVKMQHQHEGVLVFMSSIDAESSEQLFAVRGAGPPLLLSERFVRKPLVDEEGVAARYRLWEITPIDAGLRVNFLIGLDPKTSADVFETYDVTWADVNSVLEEVETSVPVQTGPKGQYRILHMSPVPAKTDVN